MTTMTDLVTWQGETGWGPGTFQLIRVPRAEIDEDSDEPDAWELIAVERSTGVRRVDIMLDSAAGRDRGIDRGHLARIGLGAPPEAREILAGWIDVGGLEGLRDHAGGPEASIDSVLRLLDGLGPDELDVAMDDPERWIPLPDDGREDLMLGDGGEGWSVLWWDQDGRRVVAKYDYTASKWYAVADELA